MCFNNARHLNLSKKKLQKKNDHQFSQEHLNNVRVLQNVWKSVEELRARNDGSVVDYQSTDERHPLLKDFKPFDIEGYWGRRQLASMNLQ